MTLNLKLACRQSTNQTQAVHTQINCTDNNAMLFQAMKLPLHATKSSQLLNAKRCGLLHFEPFLRAHANDSYVIVMPGTYAATLAMTKTSCALAAAWHGHIRPASEGNPSEQRKTASLHKTMSSAAAAAAATSSLEPAAAAAAATSSIEPAAASMFPRSTKSGSSCTTGHLKGHQPRGCCPIVQVFSKHIE